MIGHPPAAIGRVIKAGNRGNLGKVAREEDLVRGFEIGEGFGATLMNGSQHNDPFAAKSGGGIRPASNHCGGIQGGISNGETIFFRVAFKPVSTISLPQNTVAFDGSPVVFEAKGRHDPCVLPRAVPVVESMAALVLADAFLQQQVQRIPHP